MSIETAWVVQGVIVGLTTVVTAFVGFALRRLFVERMDAFGDKLEALSATVNAMALQSGKDHAEVRERIARIETLTEWR